MKSPVLTSLVALLLFNTQLRSQDTTTDPEKLPANIEKVVSGGYWERGDQDGTYRAIMLLEGWEHLSSRVLIQWVRRDGDKQELVVETTLPVKEIPGEAARRITSAEIEVPNQGQSGLQGSDGFPVQARDAGRIRARWQGNLLRRSPGQSQVLIFSRLEMKSHAY